MDSPFMPVHQHTERPLGTRTCSYNNTGHAADDCGKPATWHVAWDGEPKCSPSCEEHMALIQRTWVFDDRHQFGADCNMPGALWSYREQRCFVPTEDRRVLAAAAKETDRD